jgi:hypothetical protein
VLSPAAYALLCQMAGSSSRMGGEVAPHFSVVDVGQVSAPCVPVGDIRQIGGRYGNLPYIWAPAV